MFEHVMTGDAETFLWRCDDYPWERNVWNVHPEVEIHLVRKTSGVALVGDHIGAFDAGYPAIVGGGLPHDWVTPTRPGEVIRGRDIVVQFHPDRLRRAADALPEMTGIEAFLKLASRGPMCSAATDRRSERLGTRRGKAWRISEDGPSW